MSDYKVELTLNCNAGTWVDYSSYSDVSRMIRTKQLDESKAPMRKTGANITFFGSAYVFIKANLIDSANRASNYICVRVTDNIFGGSGGWQFKIENNSLRWCDNEKCEFQSDLTEINLYLDCAAQTPISDNTSGEYQEFPNSGYPHPRFRYCDVIKPTFLFGALVTFFNSISLILLSFTAIVVAINAIISVLNSVIGNAIPQLQLPITAADTLFGCERGWPAPFVRSYISNVCTKCGITVDATKSPIFHDSGSAYYNAAVITAYTTKGIKMDGAQGYIVQNRPSWTLTAFLRTLMMPFNARYFISDGGELFFDRKDRIGENIWGATPVLDLSGADAEYLLSSVCYSWNGKGKPYRINNRWNTDATDAIGNELLARFNGEYFDSSSPNYTDTIDQTAIEYGSAAFVLDGKDSKWDINLVKSISNQLLVWQGNGDDWNHCLKSTTDTLQLAKIVVWDGVSDIEDARATKQPYTDYLGISAFSDDDPSDLSGTIINPGDCYYYNPEMSFDPEAGAIHDNLWTEFQEIDAPDAAKKDTIQFEAVIDYCKEEFNDLDIYQTIILPNGTDEGEIEMVEFDHSKRSVKITGFIKN